MKAEVLNGGTIHCGKWAYLIVHPKYFDLLERMKQAQLERYMPCPGTYGDIIEGVQYDIDMDAKVKIKDHYRILRLDEDNNIIQETIIYRKPTSKPAKIYED